MLGRPTVRSGIAAVACALVIAACSSTGPSAPAATGFTPSVPAKATVAPADDGRRPRWFPGDVLAVKAGRLTAYAEPDETSDHSGLVKGGDLVQVVDYQMTDARGRTWLYVIALSSPVRGRLPDLPAVLPEPEFATQGWILAGDGSAPDVDSLAPRCPAVADFESVTAMYGFERLACFNSNSLTLEGISGCGPCGFDDGVYEPPWLAGDSAGSLVGNQGPRNLPLYIAPPMLTPEQGTLIRVTGHFNDPRAATCRVTLDGVQLPHAETVEMCRRHFVVDGIEVLPTPPPNPLE
ncbi:MAG TPA: hypothetical protein VHL56_09895 [Candidatus Limnocylindrales bacterium]|nr:hypothetical protein [Candidatus Limnocylindrales bacterium]